MYKNHISIIAESHSRKFFSPIVHHPDSQRVHHRSKVE